MFKYLIFLTLILFIKNEFSKEEIDYFKSVNVKVKNTQISADLREKVEALNEPSNVLGIPSLKEQIKSFGFTLMDNDKLEIQIYNSEEDAKTAIKKHIYDKKIRKKGKTELGITFTKIMTYDIYQWHKYDLLVCQGGKINALSILLKIINSKYVTIYFTSLAKLQYAYDGFVLINKSINEANPFNNKYSMTEYDFKCYDLLGIICAYEKVASGKDIKIPYLDILIRYYSIFSYYAISQAIPTSFNLPFE